MRDGKRMTEFGKAVKMRMIELGVKQFELADKLNTCPQQIVYILYGDRPYERWIEPICEVLGMDSTRYAGKQKEA